MLRDKAQLMAKIEGIFAQAGTVKSIQQDKQRFARRAKREAMAQAEATAEGALAGDTLASILESAIGFADTRARGLNAEADIVLCVAILKADRLIAMSRDAAGLVNSGRDYRGEEQRAKE